MMLGKRGALEGNPAGVGAARAISNQSRTTSVARTIGVG